MFWATPGGGVEPGESDLAAARRELMEELALDVPLDGPVHTVANEFEHNGVVVANVDVFFLGRCDRDAPRLVPTAKEERDAMQQVKWWAVEEISSAADAIFPEDLDSMVRRLV